MNSQQHFVVKKIGDKYVPVPNEAAGDVAIWTTGGGLLCGFGLLKRGTTGWLAVLAGAGMIYRGVTGRSPLQEVVTRLGIRSKDGEVQGPSFQHDASSTSTQSPEDSVDEAAMESFPASDPPARNSSTESVAPV